MNDSTPVPHTRITPEEKEMMVQAYRLGKTIRRIMRESGRSYGGVYNALQSAGVEMRPKGCEAPDTVDYFKNG